MTFLTLFVVIPILMLLALWLARNDSQVRGVMVVGSTALLALAIYLVFAFLEARETMPAEKFPFLFGDAIPWFKPLHIFCMGCCCQEAKVPVKTMIAESRIITTEMPSTPVR